MGGLGVAPRHASLWNTAVNHRSTVEPNRYAYSTVLAASTGYFRDSQPGFFQIFGNATMDDSDHRQVIAELDTLLERIDTLSQRFEMLGQTEPQRADYLALHDLQARTLQQREAHRQALDNPEASDELPPTTSWLDRCRVH